jgi:hypothetical protein
MVGIRNLYCQTVNAWTIFVQKPQMWESLRTLKQGTALKCTLQEALWWCWTVLHCSAPCIFKITVVYSNEYTISEDVTSSILSQHVSAYMCHLQGIMHQIICKIFYKTTVGTQFSFRHYFGKNCTFEICWDRTDDVTSWLTVHSLE